MFILGNDASSDCANNPEQDEHHAASRWHGTLCRWEREVESRSVQIGADDDDREAERRDHHQPADQRLMMGSYWQGQYRPSGG